MNNRGAYIGGSDIGVILGLNKWKSAAQLWAEKTGAAEPQPDTMILRTGRHMESLILDRYVELMGTKDLQRSIVAYGAEPWQVAHIDAIGDGCIVEAKFTRAASWDTIPAQYQVQAQWYMWLQDLPQTNFAVLHATGGDEIAIYEYSRDDALIERCIDAASAFWRCVEGKYPPAPQIPSDLNICFPRALRSEMIAGAAELELVAEARQARAAAAEATARADSARVSLAALMGDAELLVDTNGKKLASFKGSPRRSMRIV